VNGGDGSSSSPHEANGSAPAEGVTRGDDLSQEQELVSIGQAAKKAGVSRQSLQYYLMVGLLEPTQVSTTGRRLFGPKAIERIRLIKRLNESGYPLRAIRELFMEGRTGLKGNRRE
jgi:hypothetical protein